MISDLEKTSSKDHFIFFFTSLKEAYEATKEIEHTLPNHSTVLLIIEEETKDECTKLLNLSEKIRVYKGQAWTLIFNRRVEDGWYEGCCSKS